jgi:hypothetical protein
MAAAMVAMVFLSVMPTAAMGAGTATMMALTAVGMAVATVVAATVVAGISASAPLGRALPSRQLVETFAKTL